MLLIKSFGFQHFLQYFDNVDWVTGRTSGQYNLCNLSPTMFPSVQVGE